MADVDVIYKALRLVPDFDGNPHVLPRFINLCDQISRELIEQSESNSLVKLCLINGILNKITGPAARIINSNGIAEDWNSIKTALVNNFSDQRDETALYNDLALATQGNSTPQEFYDRCVNLFSTIMTYVTLHETVGTTVEAKRALYKKLTMQAFVRGLKEPLGSRVRCMRPESVEKALEYVQEELNVMYLQNRTEEKKTHSPQVPRPSPMTPMPMQIFKPHNFSAQQTPTNLKFSPQQFKANFNNAPVSYRPIGMPSRTQQIFRAQPPNYNNATHQNRFQIPQRHDSGSRAMSGVSHYITKERPPMGQIPGHDWRRFGNPPPSNYFKTREMNINEINEFDNYYGYYPDYYAYNEPGEYYYVANPNYFQPEPPNYVINEILNYDQPQEIPSESYIDTEVPSNSSSTEQDFPKEERSGKLK